MYSGKIAVPPGGGGIRKNTKKSIMGGPVSYCFVRTYFQLADQLRLFFINLLYKPIKNPILIK
jgi:hypothetical protein